jgi:coiled-coil domain-containing protein 77
VCNRIVRQVRRADEFEVERHDLLNRINLCQASAAENHSLRVEVQKRAEEVRELQQALSSAHVHLFEERDRLLQLQAENDALRLQDVENKRRMQHLISIVEDSHPAEDACCHPSSSATLGIVYPPKPNGRKKGTLASCAAIYVSFAIYG